MGYMSLEELRSELSLNLGGRAPAPDRLTLWVNFGYLNLCSYIMFEELEDTAAFNMIAGDTEYAVPANLLGIRTIEIWDATVTPNMRHRKLSKMHRPFTAKTQAAQPSHYRRQGSQIIIWPEPDQAYEGFIDYVKVPARLTTATSVTLIPASWDVAVVMLATHHGLLALGEADEADRWLGRFLGYASSRLKEADISADMPKGGINVAWEWEHTHENPDHLID